jgi:hypothetical protein
MDTGMEGGQGGGAGAEPQSQVSQDGDQQLSSTNAQLEAVLKKLDDLEAQVRGLQSGKDRGQSKLQKQVRSVSEQVKKVNTYLERYKDPDEAARQIALDQLLGEAGDEDEDELEVPASKGKAKPEPQASLGVNEKLFTALGVDPKDPEIQREFARRLLAGEDQLDAAIAIAEAKKLPPESPPPKPAGVAPGGAGGKTETTLAALNANYEAELNKLPRPTPVHVLHELKKKYRKLGLEVW